MPTENQREAARRNGALSHGPKTTQGKEKSAQNAVKHGLTATYNTLINENPEAFQEMLNDYTLEFAPRTPTERDAVRDLAVARWHIHRIEAIETAVLNLAMSLTLDAYAQAVPALDEPTRLAYALCHAEGQQTILHLLDRYRRTHSRLYQRALNNLKTKRTAGEVNSIPCNGIETAHFIDEPPLEASRPLEIAAASPTPLVDPDLCRTIAILRRHPDAWLEVQRDLNPEYFTHLA